MWRLEHAPTNARREALALIAGGSLSDPEARAGAEALEDFLATSATSATSADSAGPAVLWRACEGGSSLAAALVVFAVGRTALLLHSSAESLVVPPPALTDVLAAAAEEALARGATLVQALLPSEARRDIASFEAAGFRGLAELIYMRATQAELRLQPNEAQLLCRSYSARTHADFAAAIAASYRDSLDCPALTGVREMEDVLAGHKATGVFRPDTWAVAYREGRPAGVALVNENPSQRAAEVVYMGVVPQYRGQGMGRALLAHAAALARRHHFDDLCLAVDAANSPALELYRRAGLAQYDRRLALIRTRREGTP